MLTYFAGSKAPFMMEVATRTAPWPLELQKKSWKGALPWPTHGHSSLQSTISGLCPAELVNSVQLAGILPKFVKGLWKPFKKEKN